MKSDDIKSDGTWLSGVNKAITLVLVTALVGIVFGLCVTFGVLFALKVFPIL